VKVAVRVIYQVVGEKTTLPGSLLALMDRNTHRRTQDTVRRIDLITLERLCKALSCQPGTYCVASPSRRIDAAHEGHIHHRASTGIAPLVAP